MFRGGSSISLSREMGKFKAAATAVVNVQHEIAVTEYGWLMTQNKHGQKDSHAGSASLASCH